MQARSDRRSNGDRQHCIHRKRRHDHERERGTVEPHHGQEDEREDHVERHSDRMAGQELTDLLQLTHTGDRVADSSRFKIGKWKRQHVSKELRAQTHVDPIRRVSKKIGAEPAQRRFKDRQRDHADGQYMERGKALMDKHLIDDDLCKERGQQREKLKEERRNQHFAEKRAVLDDRGNEPRKIELQILQTAVSPLGQEQKFSRPHRFELLAGENKRARFDRILDQYRFRFDLRQHDIPAVLPLYHGRQWCRGQAAPLDLAQTSLQPKVFGRAEQIDIRQDLPGLRKLMPQLCAIGRKIMEASENEEANQAAVCRRSIEESSGTVIHSLRPGIVHGSHSCTASAR
ncbi:hypothetical protein COMA2_10013 [Candidatus Nitrospira nitrificans]|uniref:Uncharacterized protein n=1 Tax=Candidatus Nitrospira nitrificans TaxID=1742973 RepID=A0A0S4L3E1_9BACT|nr:hypothetical protein COMA2_10013 [Candidatus Nitrospira nitrificans]